jgi:hypothetical protein
MVDVAKDHNTDDSGTPPSVSAPAGGRQVQAAPEQFTGRQLWAAGGYAGRLRAALGPVWRDRRIALAVAVVLAGTNSPAGPPSPTNGSSC